MSTTPLRDDELSAALTALRAGSTLVVGGSRAHSTWGWGPGWYRADFDEGHEDRYETSEDAVVRALQGATGPTRDLLWNQARRELVPAFEAGDELGVRRALQAAARYRAPGADDDILVALVSPSATLDTAARDALRSHIEGFTFYHLILGALGWQRTPASGRLALAHLDRALALLAPETPSGVPALRTAFERLIAAE